MSFTRKPGEVKAMKKFVYWLVSLLLGDGRLERLADAMGGSDYD